MCGLHQQYRSFDAHLATVHKERGDGQEKPAGGTTPSLLRPRDIRTCFGPPEERERTERGDHPIITLAPGVVHGLPMSRERAAFVMMRVEAGMAVRSVQGPALRQFLGLCGDAGGSRFVRDRATERADTLTLARFLREETLERLAHRDMTIITDGRKWGRFSYCPYLVWFVDLDDDAKLFLLNLFAYKSATSSQLGTDLSRSTRVLLAVKARPKAGCTDNCSNLLRAIKKLLLTLGGDDLLQLLQMSGGIHTSLLVPDDLAKGSRMSPSTCGG